LSKSYSIEEFCKRLFRLPLVKDELKLEL